MYRFFKDLFVLFVVSWMLCGCAAISPAVPLDGQVIPVHIGTSMMVVHDAIAMKAGTMVLEDGTGNFVFMRALKDQGWVFVNISLKDAKDVSKLITEGNLINCKESSQFVSFLKNNGWELIHGSEVPALLKAAAQSGTINFVMRSMVSFMVLPLGSVPDLQEYLTPEEVIQ